MAYDPKRAEPADAGVQVAETREAMRDPTFQPAQPLSDYQLYFFDKAGQRIVYDLALLSGDDAAAMRLAVGLADGSPMELWNRARFVARYPAQTYH
jgi:hypothetical protein